MPKLIYLCEPNSSVNEVVINSSQIDDHAKKSISAVKVFHPSLSNEKYINVIFNQTGNGGKEKNFYLALFHTFLYAEPFDVVLINSSFIFSKSPEIDLPFSFDKLLNDMFSNLMGRNITVILSSGNSRNDINDFVRGKTTDFGFIMESGQCKTSQKNKSSIIVGGINESNNGNIVDCYFSALGTFGESSAGSAKAAGMVLKMQDYAENFYADRSRRRYLKSLEIKQALSTIGVVEPIWDNIKIKIDNFLLTSP